ncbi:MAG: hypothetical protein IKU88_05940 [Alistipes sp.]|nr:hypothetical protein [Alistipes sp.]
MSYNIAFFVIISILLLSPLLSFILDLRLVLVAKAGKVDKFFLRYKLSSCKIPKEIKCGNDTIAVSKLSHLYVHGNSMKDYNILNGQYVFVEPYNTTEAKQSIQTYPVLVFDITEQTIQSKYKLRKFVSYINIDNVDWINVYTENHSRIKISQEVFVQECIEKVNKLDHSDPNYILSETFDEEKDRCSYSLHPVKTLYAKVKYSCNLN